MKVLCICDVLLPQTVGGAGRVARELALALQDRNVEVSFFTRDVPVRPADTATRTRYFPKFGGFGSRGIRQLFLNEVAMFQPDIIHVHQPLPAYRAFREPLAIPYVYTFHSSWPEEFAMKASGWPRTVRGLLRPVLQHVEARVLRSAAAITVLSQYSSDLVARKYGHRCRIIPGGVDMQRFQSSSVPRSGNPIRLITVRNLVPRMGLEPLVEAMHLLPDNVTLDIAGTGPLQSRLEGLIERQSLRARVRLIGHLPEAQLPDFYAAANWFVLPSVAMEGFGMVVLESLACGTGVIGTRIGAIPELLGPLNPEWIIDRPEPDSIARTIRQAISSPTPDRNRLRDFAREFDWPHIAEQFHSLFSEILDRGPSTVESDQR